MQKVNSDLVGKYINILSRCAKVLEQSFAAQLRSQASGQWTTYALTQSASLCTAYRERRFQQAAELCMKILQSLNSVLTEKQPWKGAKDLQLREEAWECLTDVLQAFKIVTDYLLPIMPRICAQVLEYFPAGVWGQPVAAGLLRSYTPIITRLPPDFELTEIL